MKSHISKICHSRAARVSQGTLQAIWESLQTCPRCGSSLAKAPDT
ncbi:MAG: hypothetical protein NTX42_11130 [Methanothrix sp.]|nr:hypothetical protein [Methanothrix sp.]